MPHHEPEDLRKEQILRSAFDCFSERGFEIVTMEEIAKEAGLSKGAVYWYFKSKDELILELIRNWNKTSENLLYKMALECSLDELLYKYPAYIIKEMDLKNHYKLLFHLWARSIDNKEVYRHMSESYGEWKEKAVEFIKSGITRKIFRDDLNAEVFADTVDGLFNGLMVQWHLDKKMDFEKCWKTAIDLLMEGVKAKTVSEETL